MAPLAPALATPMVSKFIHSRLPFTFTFTVSFIHSYELMFGLHVFRNCNSFYALIFGFVVRK